MHLAVETVIAASADDRSTYVRLLRRQRVWLEQEMGVPLGTLQPSAAGEYDDPFGHYAESGTLAVLARVDGIAVGIAALRPLVYGDPTEAELKRVFVRSEWRGLGVGRRLVEGALVLARRHGMRRVLLETHEGHMPRAVALYRSIGFRPAPSIGSTTASDVLTLGVEA